MNRKYMTNIDAIMQENFDAIAMRQNQFAHYSRNIVKDRTRYVGHDDEGMPSYGLNLTKYEISDIDFE